MAKPWAMPINTSRGGLVDTEAVIAALKSRQLGALRIDGYESRATLATACCRDATNPLLIS